MNKKTIKSFSGICWLTDLSIALKEEYNFYQHRENSIPSKLTPKITIDKFYRFNPSIQIFKFIYHKNGDITIRTLNQGYFKFIKQ